jgi:hypothetical protein
MKKYKIRYQMRENRTVYETVENSSVPTAGELAARLAYFGREDKRLVVTDEEASFAIPFEQILYIAVKEIE